MPMQTRWQDNPQNKLCGSQIKLNTKMTNSCVIHVYKNILTKNTNYYECTHTFNIHTNTKNHTKKVAFKHKPWDKCVYVFVHACVTPKVCVCFSINGLLWRSKERKGMKNMKVGGMVGKIMWRTLGIHCNKINILGLASQGRCTHWLQNKYVSFYKYVIVCEGEAVNYLHTTCSVTCWLWRKWNERRAQPFNKVKRYDWFNIITCMTNPKASVDHLIDSSVISLVLIPTNLSKIFQVSLHWRLMTSNLSEDRLKFCYLWVCCYLCKPRTVSKHKTITEISGEQMMPFCQYLNNTVTVKWSHCIISIPISTCPTNSNETDPNMST